MKKRDLTQGSIPKMLMGLALPMIASHTLQDAFSFVDMLFVSRLGSEAIAAVAISGNLLRLISVIALGVSTGTVIIIAQFLGAKKTAEAIDVAMQAIILALGCALVVAAVGCLLARPGLKLMGAEAIVVQLGTPYLRAMFVGTIAMFLSMTLGSIYRASGDTLTPMLVLVFSTCLNIVVDPMLIFGLWIFPRLGVVGSAYATILGRTVGVVVLGWLCFSARGPLALRNANRQIDLSVMRGILKLGIFSSMQGLLRHSSRVVFVRVVNLYGTHAMAAYAICMRLRIFVMHPGFGIANAVGPMVGQNLGADQISRAERSVRIGIVIVVIVMSVIGSAFLIAPAWFLGWFSKEAEVLKMGSSYLRYLSVTFGFIGLSLVFGRALNGAGDTVSPMTITGICQLGVGLILVLALSHVLGVTGVWVGIATANVIQGLAMWLWFRRGAWKMRSLVAPSASSDA